MLQLGQYPKKRAGTSWQESALKNEARASPDWVYVIGWVGSENRNSGLCRLIQKSIAPGSAQIAKPGQAAREAKQRRNANESDWSSDDFRGDRLCRDRCRDVDELLNHREGQRGTAAGAGRSVGRSCKPERRIGGRPVPRRSELAQTIVHLVSGG